jgi:hypothetical protein
MQERVGAPSICTVHAPHSAMPQPNFVPVMPSTSRNTQRSGVSPSTSTLCVLPLSLIAKAMASSEALSQGRDRVAPLRSVPTATELQSSNDMFFSTLAQPGAQARRAKVRSIGYGLPSDFELNFGRYLPALGRADDDDTDMRPD